jgi:hypothetical protein
MTDRKPQFGDVPADEFDRDLSPDPLAGQNLGPRTDDALRARRTAFDIKPIHRALREWPDEELKAIPVLEEGSPLQQGATYINLADAERNEITAMGTMRVGRGEAFIPKDDVPYATWNRLRGIDSPERTGGEPLRDR